MTKELIINAREEGVEIALLEDKKLVELHYEQGKDGFSVGDFYLGKVKKLMPGLNAAFVDVGFEKDAFLHYTDLSPFFGSLLRFTQGAISGNPPWGKDFGKFENAPEIPKSGKIVDVMAGKPEVIVQILKEPISTKGPRLSCEVSLPGRFLVMTPFNDTISVSRKIHSSEERRRLQRIVEAIKPKNLGIIIRTAAEGKNTAELHGDIMDLEASWKAIQENLKSAKAPQKILGERDKTTSILRDLLNDSFQKIVVNDKKLLEEVMQYITRIAPEKAEIVSLYNNAQPVFDTYNITKQVKAAFGRTVSLPSGAYLIIEHTEAMHVIDVNSGTRPAEANQEANALQTNLECIKEIARQMRLRDLGGILTIDFIDMRLPENRKHVHDAMEEAMATDRARHTVLPLSKFGLMQITRQRLRPEITISTLEQCPCCKGTGKIGPSVLIADDMERDLKYLVSQGHRALHLLVNPILAAYLTKGILNSISKKWKKTYELKTLKVVEDNDAGILEYKFFDAKTEEAIRL